MSNYSDDGIITVNFYGRKRSDGGKVEPNFEQRKHSLKGRRIGCFQDYFLIY